MSFQENMARQDTVQLLTLGASLSLVYSSHAVGVTNFALFVSANERLQLPKRDSSSRSLLNTALWDSITRDDFLERTIQTGEPWR